MKVNKWIVARIEYDDRFFYRIIEEGTDRTISPVENEDQAQKIVKAHNDAVHDGQK